MPPADGSSTRGGSTSVRGRVRSPHTAELQAASVPIAQGSCAPTAAAPRDRQTTGGSRYRLMPPTAGHNKFKKAWIISQCYTWDWAATVESCSQCFSWSRHRSILSRLSLSTTTLRACNCVFAHCYDFINYNAFILHGVTCCIFTNLFWFTR